MEYSYDSRGNLLSKTYSDGTSITYGYTDTTWKDRLTSYNGTAISYDTIGNPLSWHNGSAMTWQRGRQLASYTNNGITSTYAYDDTGLRTSKTVGGVTTTYSVVDGSLRRMSDGTNTLQFVYGNGLSSVIFNGTEYWYVYNAQGDVIGLIDNTGAYVVQYTYDAWGNPLSKIGSMADSLGTLNPFRYRGYIYDEETGLYYVSSRYYDPEIGRWLNCDNEIAGVGGDVRGYNTFAYCFNNPINMSDPSGNWSKWVKNAANWVKDVIHSIGAVVRGVNASVSTGGGFGASVEIKSTIDVSALVKADIQQISVSGYNGVDFGKEYVAEVGVGIGPWEAEVKKGEYHSDLCSYYSEYGNHDTSNCPNTIVYTPEFLETNMVLFGIDVYFVYGVSAEISFDYKSVDKHLIEIWGD